MRKFFIAISLLAASAGAQTLELTNEVIASSDYTDSHDNVLGNGWIDRLHAIYDFPISMHLTDDRRPIVWRGVVRGTYSYMQNNGAAAVYNPDNILNATANVMHIRPIASRWTLIATAGVGIHTAFDALTWRDFAVNAAAIFSYKYSEQLDYGIGAALVTTYGWPLVLPMPYLRWHNGGDTGAPTPGTWVFDVNFMGHIQATASTWLTQDVSLMVNIFEMESTFANVKMDGKWKVYSSTTMQSSVCPSLRLGPGKLSAALGVAWRRGTRISDRSYSGFFKGFNHNRRRNFGTAVYVSLGYSMLL